MVRNSNRRRPALTPKLKLSNNRLGQVIQGPTEPRSPPETPTTMAAVTSKSPHLHTDYPYSRSLVEDPSIKPVGNGHQFSYRRVQIPERLSPASSSSSSSSSSSLPPSSESGCQYEASPSCIVIDEGDTKSSSRDDSSDHYESELDVGDVNYSSEGGAGGSDNEGDSKPDREQSPGCSSSHTTASGSCGQSNRFGLFASSASKVCGFVLEDVDSMDSECDELEVLHPNEIESARSRSRTRNKDLDREMMHHLKNLNCSNETSENESDACPDEEVLFYKRQQELKRIRRVSMSSSFGKRTHSEISDSSDDENGGLEANDVDWSARRMRKRLHRGSLLFQDPPAPRIDELEEPDSSEENDAEFPLARELPYWAVELMEMDSNLVPN